VPDDAVAGKIIEATSPFGNKVKCKVPIGVAPGQTFTVLDTSGPQTDGAPAQHNMIELREGGDIFHGAQKLVVRQETAAAVGLCSFESGNRYRVSAPGFGGGDEKGGAAFLHISEESRCGERVCCGSFRSLTLRLHDGTGSQAPVVQTMRKSFGSQGCCCCCRGPTVSVSGRGGASDNVGEVLDPFRCFAVEHRIVDKDNQPRFSTKGSALQCGLCFPFCCEVGFDVHKDGAKVASISRPALTCTELCVHSNRFTIDFDKLDDPVDRQLLMCSAMLLELQYFEL